MTTMLKRILKGGRDRTSKDIDYNSQIPYRAPNVTPSINSTSSAAAVDYNRSPPDVASAISTNSSSFTPAEYQRVRPDVDPYMSQPLPQQPYNRDQSIPSVEYNNSSPTRQYPSYSIGPAVQYNESSPKRTDSSTSEIYTDSSGRQKDPRATYIPTAYNSNPPSAAQNSGREFQAPYPPVQYEAPIPAAITSPSGVEYGRQPPPMQSPYDHERVPPPMSSPGMPVSYGQTPVDRYTSMNAQVQPQPPPPPRPVQQYPNYGNPGENAANQRSPYNYQEHNWASPTIPSNPPQYFHHNEAQNTPARFENNYSESGKSSESSLYSPPYSTASNSTAPTSIYTPDRQSFAGQNTPSTYSTPTLPPRNQQTAALPSTFSDSTTAATTSTNDPNVSKFTVRIFCQRKREEGDTHEESPRDIREFRLANLALIKLAAGGERYVLLDAVFGELDKAIAPLLEKHWYLTQNTTVEDHFVPGGKNVVAVGKIMVAYKGTQSTLYADFKKDDEYARFKLEMEYAMNTIRSNGPKKNEKEVQQYRY